MAPKVFGILSITFGAVMTLFSGLFALAGLIATEGLGAQKRPEDAPLVMMFLAIAAWSALLIAVGVGQVRYRHWSLSATWVWSASGVLVALVCIVGFAMVLPRTEAAASFATPTALLLPYPVLMVIFFTRPAVKESLKG